MGHGTYLAFILSFVNFVLISYNLFLEKVFPDLTLFEFCLVFGLIYVPASTLIGIRHIRKQVKYDTGKIFNQDPGHQAMMDHIIAIRKILEEKE